jgi:large subunit ribosomal protein L29
MKKKEMNELKEKDLKALKDLAKKVDQEIFKLKMDKRTAKLKNVSSLGQKRRDLAKIKTIIREKELNL